MNITDFPCLTAIALVGLCATGSIANAAGSTSAVGGLTARPAVGARPADLHRESVAADVGGSLDVPTFARIERRAALVFSGRDAPSNHGMDLSSSLSGLSQSELAGAYTLAITADQAAAPSGFIDAFQVIDTVGGGRFSGLRTGIHSLIGFNATPDPAAMASDDTSRDLVSNIAEGYADHPWGGTNEVGMARGNLTGYNANVRLTANVSHWNILAAQENDISAGGAAGLFRKYGTLYVQAARDTTHATGEEAWQEFVTARGGAGFKTLIQLGGLFGDQSSPLSPDGSIMSAVFQYGRKVVNALYGIDLRNVSFGPGGLAFASPGFGVHANGGLFAASIATSAIRASAGLSAIANKAGGEIGGSYDAGPTFPTFSIEAPAATGGVAASAAVTAIGWTGGGRMLSPGVGCSVGDVMTPRGATGTPYQWKVLTVDGRGGVASIAPTGNAAGLMTAPFPAKAQTMSGGTCKVPPIYQPTVFVPATGYKVTDPGSGYAVPPPVALSPSPVGDDPHLVAELAPSLALSADAGTLSLEGGKIALSGHVLSAGPKPTVSDCGTSPGVSGSDNAGLITVGSDATSCRLIFATPYAARPFCTVTGESGQITYSVSPTAITIRTRGRMDIDYQCTGRAEG